MTIHKHSLFDQTLSNSPRLPTKTEFSEGVRIGFGLSVRSPVRGSERSILRSLPSHWRPNIASHCISCRDKIVEGKALFSLMMWQVND